MTLETKTGLQALALTAGIALVCGGGVFLFQGCGSGSGGKGDKNNPTNGTGTKPSEGSKPSNLSADNEGKKWNTKELIDHFNNNGMQLVQRTSTGDVFAVEDSATYDRAIVNHVDHDLIMIVQCNDAQSAHDMIGPWKGGVAWGRFALKCSPSSLPKVKKALGIK